MTFFQVDLTEFEEQKQLIRQVKPDAIIHAAAMTDPNFCQTNRSDSYQINTQAAINIAGLSSDLQIPCLFTSSDLVFDGLNPPYTEDDEPSPVCTYGEQKALAEVGMKDRNPATIICRLPLMFGDPGPASTSFIQPLIKAMKLGEQVNLFIDEFRTPLSGKDAAGGMMIALNKRPEIIHLGGLERISRYEFGQVLADVLQIRQAKLNPCKQQDIKMAAPRPPDVSLDSSRAKAMGFQPNSLIHELEQLRDIFKT